MEWSNSEMSELGDMLIRGLSIEELARLLCRYHGDVRDKVIEVAGVCRSTNRARHRFQ